MKTTRFASPLITLRAALLIGGLGFLWLVMAGMLLIEIEQQRSQNSEELTETGDAVPAGLDLSAPAEPPPPSIATAPVAAVAPVQPAAVTRHRQGGAAELEAFLLVTKDQLARPQGRHSSATVPPGDLVTRLNADGRVIVVRFTDPNLSEARQKAVRAHALLVEAGLRPWLVEAYGVAGSEAITAEYAH